MELNKRNIKIYVLSGKARSGKDKVANMIVDLCSKSNKKAIKISYAYYLKEYAKNILGWNGEEETKPRTFLQELGIDLIKNKIDDKFLINRVLQDIEVYSYFYDVIIISDARLKDEIEKVKEKYNNTSVIHIIGNGNDLNEKEKTHITEVALDNYHNYDYEIKNIDLNKTREAIEKIVIV